MLIRQCSSERHKFYICTHCKDSRDSPLEAHSLAVGNAFLSGRPCFLFLINSVCLTQIYHDTLVRQSHNWFCLGRGALGRSLLLAFITAWCGAVSQLITYIQGHWGENRYAHLPIIAPCTCYSESAPRYPAWSSGTMGYRYLTASKLDRNLPM